MRLLLSFLGMMNMLLLDETSLLSYSFTMIRISQGSSTSMRLMVLKSRSLQQLFVVEDSFSSWLWIVGLLQNSSISDGCELINIQSEQSFIRVLLMHFKMMI